MNRPSPFLVFAMPIAALLVSWLTLATATQAAEPTLLVLPESLSLTGRNASANVLVQHSQDSIVGAEIRDGVKLRVLDMSVATIEQGQLVATGDGKTELVVEVAGYRPVRVPVEVQATAEPNHWQFNAHVQSIFARQGCNSGACHGALAGKAGFRLSLRGYDSAADHRAITRQDHGRRIEPADPGRSLILAKPSGLIPHKGGLRLEENSLNYRIIAEWIASGYPGPDSEDASLTRIEVLPESMMLAAADTQQLIVRAHYSDGRIEDVTRWAKFNSADEAVAEVDEQGLIQLVGNGKGAVVVWFASRIAISSIASPYENSVTETAYQDFKPSSFIDEILLDEWKALKLAPSPGCSDETFLRRAYLDATGTLPTAAQVREFAGNSDTARREQLIDKLLDSEAYVDYWSYQWSDLFLVNGNLLRPDAVAAFYKWIRAKVETNAPWDQFAREIVLARGDSLKQGATNFYAIHQDPESLSENTCQAFMGLSIGCAKCHNHPLEKWTNDQYYAMANIFARVRAKGWGGDARNGDGVRTLVVLDRGDLIQPSRGKPQPPAPLDSEAMDMDSTQDRRSVLADWLTSPDNRHFSRSIVNRVWSNYLGVGLVESVDDLRASNPASSERLLDALADYLVANDYDLKALSRLIMNSAVYQRSTEATAHNVDDERFYCRYYPRRLMAEVLHDAIVAVTGVPTQFSEIEFSGADKKPTDFYPAGTQALELYDSAVANYFLKTFGRHQRRITCDCERSDQATVVQVLHLNNGSTINDKLSDAACVVTHWVTEQWSAERAVDEAYLAVLSRPASAEERKRVVGLIVESDAAGIARRESFEDLLWSLMTSPEFLFTH